MLPGATPFAVGIISFVPKSFSLSNMVILSLKKNISSKGRFDLKHKSMSQISYKPPMWFVGTQVHFFTFRKASTLSPNALPFKGSSIVGRSLSLHSVFRFVSHLTIFASVSRESHSLQFLYVFSLLPILVFSWILLSKLSLLRREHTHSTVSSSWLRLSFNHQSVGLNFVGI